MKRALRRLLLFVLPVLAGASGWWWLTPTESADVYGGLPHVQDRWLRYATHSLQNPGFVVGYNEWYRLPLWVAFRARPVGSGSSGPRPEGFEVDARTLVRVSAADYRRGDYDRGHMAPNYLISRLYGRDAQRATFYMSNIAPQTQRLNQLLWQRLEEAEADVVAPRMQELWVITGPVLGAAPLRLDSGVAIPEAYYRIWLDETEDGSLRAIAFVVPQDVRGDEPLDRYAVTVQDVEDRTGLDFFPDLEDGVEERMENVAMPSYWQMARYANAPARYAGKRGFRELP